MIDTRRLNIIDENDNIIGETTREEIHAKGLLHREIHVWLYNSKEIFFQKRAYDKDTFPGLLDASIGGHVEIGESYEETAVKETEEETGLKINPKDLKLVTIIRNTAHDEVTGRINNVIRKIFAYEFNGPVSDLRIEKGKAVGFEAVKIDSLFQMSDEEKRRFIYSVFDDRNLEVFRKIKTFL